MRSHLACILGLLLATTAAGCAAPYEEDVGSAEGAAVTLDGHLDEGELAALRYGAGLRCTQGEDAIMLCTHERGTAVVSDHGIALLEAKDDILTAKALASDAAQARDVEAVLAPVAPGETSTQSLAPRAVGGQIVRDIFMSLFGKSLKRMTLSAAEREAEIVATRSAERAGQLAVLQAELREGQGIVRAGVTTEIVGSTAKLTTDGVKRWAAATGRRVVGIGHPSSNSTGPEDIRKFLILLKTDVQHMNLKPGERVAIMYSPTIGSRHEVERMAHAAGFDVILANDRAYEGIVPDALALVRGVDNDYAPIRAVAERMYEVSSRFVGRI